MSGPLKCPVCCQDITVRPTPTAVLAGWAYELIAKARGYLALLCDRADIRTDLWRDLHQQTNQMLARMAAVDRPGPGEAP